MHIVLVQVAGNRAGYHVLLKSLLAHVKRESTGPMTHVQTHATVNRFADCGYDTTFRIQDASFPSMKRMREHISIAQQLQNFLNW